MKSEIKVDYHFYPNFSRKEARATQKITKIYKKFQELDIKVVIVTEHVYKNYLRAWQLMEKYKPDNIFIFPGMEYVTKENIDICLFSKTASIYQYNFRPFQLNYKELILFLKRHPDVFGFVTHPFTLGRTSIVDKKGKVFTKNAIDELGTVEAVYTVFS